MTTIQIMVLVAFGFACYGFLSARLSKTIQPLRLKVAEDIEDLISDESIKKNTRDDLDRLGDSLFSKFGAWMLILTYPIGVYYALKGDDGKHQEPGKGHPRRKEISYTYASGIFCMMASSPLTLVVFFVEVMLLMIVFAPLGKASRKALHIVFSIEDSRSHRASV